VTVLRRDRHAGPLKALIARAEAWLLAPPGEATARQGEPPPPCASRSPVPPLAPPQAPVVAVVALAPRAGASTIARALAGRLARDGSPGASVVHGRGPRRAGPAALAARRHAHVLAARGIEDVRLCGRLCLLAATEPLGPLVAQRIAPVVVDVGHGEPAEPALGFADHVVLIAPPEVEPALAATVAGSLRAGGKGTSLVVNRALEDPRAELGTPLVIAESRLAAAAAQLGRATRGPLAKPIRELAERCRAEAVR
jgi:hypothetical protein